MPKLTKSFVDATNTPGKYRDDDLPGFLLKVTEHGKKVYVVDTKLKGTRKNVTVTLGTHGKITPREAREKAQKALSKISDGINPNVERKRKSQQEEQEALQLQQEQDRKNLTLSAVLEEYFKAHGLKSSTIYGYRKALERCVPEWMNFPLCDITKDLIKQKHQSLSKQTPAQANLVMRILRAVFTFASVNFDGIVTENPATVLSRTRAWNRIPRRKTAIKSHQLQHWLKAVCELEHQAVRDYLLLMILTGLRKSEAASLKWADVDFSEKSITVRETKNHEDHKIPMCTFVFKLLKARFREGNVFVFPGRNSDHLIDTRKQMIKVQQQSAVQFSLHDLRRTFATIAEGLDIQGYTLKRLLNHKNTADVTSGYIVSDFERLRVPMTKIENYILATGNIAWNENEDAPMPCNAHERSTG